MKKVGSEAKTDSVLSMSQKFSLSLKTSRFVCSWTRGFRKRTHTKSSKVNSEFSLVGTVAYINDRYTHSVD